MEPQSVAVEGVHLSKVYEKTGGGLKHCQFQISQGRTVALVGANGAGKTTLMNLLIGTAYPTSGQVLWFGQPISESIPRLYDRVAFVPEEHRFYPKWTGNRVIEFVRSFHFSWNKAAEGTLRKHLNIPLDQRISTYSKGNLAKLSLLLAMSQGATVFLLDEPFSGLDPLIREELVQILSAVFHESKSTVVMTSHDLFAAEALAQELWVLHRGNFLVQGPMREFVESYKSITVSSSHSVTAREPSEAIYRREVSAAADRNHSQYILVARGSEEFAGWAQSNGALVEERCATLHEAYAACVYNSDRGK